MSSWATSPVSPPAPLSSLQQQASTLTGTTLMDYVQQQTLQFILSKRPLSQWDSYLGELETEGATQFVSNYNKAYNTYKTKYA
jgi:putative aldouronate transport system substrate-binding protein